MLPFSKTLHSMFPTMNYDFESVFGYKPDAVGIDQLETFTNHHALVIWKLKISREKKKELFMRVYQERL